MTTPTTTQANAWAVPVTEHASTVRSYPDGFILEIEFSFDPAQIPIFPATGLAQQKHRPTFLGNSGIGIYNWIKPPNSESIGYLYEVQVTDTSGITGGKRSFADVEKNRFVRLDYGADWTQKGVWKMVGSDQQEEDTLLANEKSHLDPRKYAAFVAAIEGPVNDRKGGADCLCAIVAGLPVSYFQDIYEERMVNGVQEKFPEPDIAISSAIPFGANLPNPLPISGTEDPLRIWWEHRADYVPAAGGEYQHFNHLDSGAWNTLRICFLPARYKPNGEKCKNAYLHTHVNSREVFKGEIKSGTRTSRHTNTQDPEPAVTKGENGDLKIRLLGHWGSTVKYRNVTIRSVGSTQ